MAPSIFLITWVSSLGTRLCSASGHYPPPKRGLFKKNGGQSGTSARFGHVLSCYLRVWHFDQSSQFAVGLQSF